MKKLLFAFLAFSIMSCDDGDVIVDDLDFEDIAIEACLPVATTGDRDYVFYKVDQSNFESLSIAFSSSDDLLIINDTYTFTLNSNSTVDYRRYNEAPDSDYFCGAVPPVSPRVIESYVAQNGTFTLTTSTFSQDDNDGIPAIQELDEDTDGDGIPNFLDIDDDGDNVPTSDEGVVLVNDEISLTLSRDTDGDGILDYLDNDDDGDGILTIQEDVDRNLNPADDLDVNGDAYYLVSEVMIAASPPINEFAPNIYSRRSALQFDFQNLVLNGDGKELVFDNLDFGSFTTSNIDVETTPEFVQD